MGRSRPGSPFLDVFEKGDPGNRYVERSAYFKAKPQKFFVMVSPQLGRYISTHDWWNPPMLQVTCIHAHPPPEGTRPERTLSNLSSYLLSFLNPLQVKVLPSKEPLALMFCTPPTLEHPAVPLR